MGNTSVRRIVDRLDLACLTVEAAEIVVHEADQPISSLTSLMPTRWVSE
jgi:hypothetical protein